MIAAICLLGSPLVLAADPSIFGEQGPGTGEVTFQWTGGVPPFEVYRSTNPTDVLNPANLIATVNVPTWSGPCPQSPVVFYQVVALGTPECTVDADCQDSTLCNGAEVCVLDTCQPGVPPDCNDGIACTVDSCDPATGACDHAPMDSLCPCGEFCDPVIGCDDTCIVRDCAGVVFECGDCIDNDGDCRIDGRDDQCLGACDDSEASLYPDLPGGGIACRPDCYFDLDAGAGNDDCLWSHRCDPLEIPPDYNPAGSACEYDPSTIVSGQSCFDMMSFQSSDCLDFCVPLTPNGCDCFGCCEVPGTGQFFWLGSEDEFGTGSCDLNSLGDPSLCKPCTPVPACEKPCGTCELCVGKTTLPASCTDQECPVGADLCGLPGQADCPAGSFCITGCCQLLP